MASFAGDKTEKPTARRLKDSREKGEVARSRDLTAAVSLLAVTIGLGWFGGDMIHSITDRLTAGLRTLGDQPLMALDSTRLTTMLWADAWRFTMIAGPILFVGGVISIGASVAQFGWMVSPKAAEFNWGRLSPASGFSKLLPKQAGPELAKALICASALAAVCAIFIRQAFDNAPAIVAMTPSSAIHTSWGQMTRLLWRGSITLFVLAAGDYGLQRWRWYSQVKMTRQEVRDDARQQDGSPEIKARVRRVQREMTRRRM